MEGRIVPERGRLFVGSCAAVIALAFSFASLSGVMYELKGRFLLDNAQVGLIGGAGLWGMAISQLGFSSLCDVVGMRTLMRLAALGHVAGTLLFVSAGGFAGLFAGALLLAIANGMVEAVCNPLVATLYPDRKAGMLNRLHLWFPGGVALGGLAVWLLDLAHAGWQAKMLLLILPTCLYVGLFLRAPFPATECAQQGGTPRDALKAVLSTPILWLFLLLMAMTMSLELGPNRWIPAVLEAGGLPGILVLVMINGVMAIARANAHGILRRVSPPALLMGCTGTAGLGLWWLSHATSAGETVAAALLFAIGISMVWPTMMGFVAERAPRTGALGLGMMAAAGSLALGLVTTPLLGRIADDHLPRAVPAAPLHALAVEVATLPGDTQLRIEARVIRDSAEPPAITGDFLRRVAAGAAGPGPAATAGPLLSVADNRSGLLSFRSLVPFAALVCLVFGFVTVRDRRSGGYAAEVERARLSQGVSA